MNYLELTKRLKEESEVTNSFIKDKILEQYQLATSQTTFANDDIDDIITK